MNFNFLFQNYEGVQNLTKRKARILTFLSLGAMLVAIIFVAYLAFFMDKHRLIPGVITLGLMFLFMLVITNHGRYTTATYQILVLPLSLYFLCINSQYSVVDNQMAEMILYSGAYAGLLFLLIFSSSLFLFVLYYLETLSLFLYFYFENENWDQILSGKIYGILLPIHPAFELTFLTLLFASIFHFLHRSISETDQESVKIRQTIDEGMRQMNIGIMRTRTIGKRKKHPVQRTIMQVNNYFEKIFQVSANEITGKRCEQVFPVLFGNSFDWEDEFIQNPKGKVEVYMPNLDKWFYIYHIFPEPTEMVTAFVNITALKSEIHSLQTRKDRLTDLLGSIPDIFFILNKEGIYIDYVSNNPELEELGHKDIIGKSIFEMGFSKAMSYQIYCSIQTVLAYDTLETIEYGMELLNGKLIVFEMRLARLNETQVISIGRDITRKKELEHQLMQARHSAEEARKLKSAFLENISHEMRTPMNSILGFSKMAASDIYSPDEKKNFLDIVLKNGERMMDLLTNVIELSELDSGLVRLKIGSFKINQLLYELYDKYLNRIQISKKNLLLEIELGEPANTFEISIDAYLVERILTHLLDNAIKFSSQGKIRFGYLKRYDTITVFVSDEGIGIAESDQELIFEFFHQLDNKLTKRYAGIGSGLSIVKGYVGLLGSNLVFHSEMHKGSTFQFDFNLTKH
jgi:signal transduction histidine kinase